MSQVVNLSWEIAPIGAARPLQWRPTDRSSHTRKDTTMKSDKKNTDKRRLSLKKLTLKTLSSEAMHGVQGGLMPVGPRTDCICCKACATYAC